MEESAVAVREKIAAVKEKGQKKTVRSLGLDALRGLAIIGMVFSGVFPHEEPWPAWMFHAQVRPPDFTYTPDVPGITWVDLVFPFFIFAMGAAFPLALSKKVKTGQGKVILNTLQRGALLVFFAIVLRHVNPGFLKGELWLNYFTGIIVFLSFFLFFMRFKIDKRKVFLLRLVGLAIILTSIALHSEFTTLDFNLYRQDIIILVLANMAVFGALIWVFTKDNLMLRLGILAVFAGIWLTRDYEGSYSQAVFTFHPTLSWFYQFAFLKYLNVIIPGTILGDLLLKSAKDNSNLSISKNSKYLIFIAAGLLVVNLYGLFTRQLLFTFIADTILCLAGAAIVRKFTTGKELLFKKLFYWGVFWLFLGLAFEPLDGGIKKDPSSFSFWFLTSGLAFFTYIACEIVSIYKPQNKVWKSVIQTGQNPMVAYTAGSFVILPVIYFSGISEVLNYLRDVNLYLGIAKALVVTAGVVWLTSYTTRRKWFWKT